MLSESGALTRGARWGIHHPRSDSSTIGRTSATAVLDLDGRWEYSLEVPFSTAFPARFAEAYEPPAVAWRPL